MEHSNFTTEDFVADETFQQYCSGRDHSSVLYWTNWVAQHPEKRVQIAEAKRMYLLLSGNHEAKEYLRHRELFHAKFKAHLNPIDLQREVKMLPVNYRPWIAAASIALICMSALFLYQQYFSVHHPATQYVFRSNAGQKRIVKLADGTVVTLNAGSHITLDTAFNLSNRKLSLSGEAYFKVKHNQKMPFTVVTDKLLITDLGTTFNVKAYAGDTNTEATLIEGEIAVAPIFKPQSTIRLKPNQKIVFRNSLKLSDLQQGNIQDSRIFNVQSLNKNPLSNTITETDWVQNRLTFNDEDFSSIATKMERWYGLNISFENEDIKKYRFVGTFDNQSVDEVLEILKLSREFNYRKEGTHITIY